MDESNLGELKEWLRIDGTDEDTTLLSLIIASRFIIKQTAGVILSDVQADSEALELYKTVQKIIITDLHENKDGSQKSNPMLISLCTQLEAYKLSGGAL